MILFFDYQLLCVAFQDFQIKETAKAMVDNGMKDLGFNWIVLDDCWHPSRADNGTLVPFPDFFPDVRHTTNSPCI